ncbi:substrate-binding periplasmic protein [Rheinheimera maricola]|uniref:Transporter substrate-binding domain-containing protein n=1 Tax=Rheinheimera maricola TaxID=2793282 RepID=A0ABS7X961_9GAMM|nr:transporter substrate-binding domain-containing protein [Rheinheimera maricola]MBZ9612067.1 transporter substrate-binding domain-containing protein [Rheinheimera maricola]
MRVVTELSPPHQTLVQGEVSGLSTELVKDVLAAAGLAGKFELYPWARSFRIARSQPNVLIYNMARTTEREAQFHWIGTVAAYQLGFVALSHRDDIQINTVTDAIHYTVAVQRDDISADFLMKNGFKKGMQLVLAADITESWQLLFNGKVDLVIDDPVALTGMAMQLGVANQDVRFVYGITELEQHTWLAASLQTPPELIERLQQAHSQIAKTERYRRIMASDYR